MENLTAHTTHLAILLGMIAASWVLPRTKGLLGLLAAQFCGVIGMVFISYVSLLFDIGPDYEPPELLGCVIFGISFNILTLPLSITAMSRWKPALAPELKNTDDLTVDSKRNNVG